MLMNSQVYTQRKFLDDLDDYKVFKACTVNDKIYWAVFAEYWRIILK